MILLCVCMKQKNKLTIDYYDAYDGDGDCGGNDRGGDDTNDASGDG